MSMELIQSKAGEYSRRVNIVVVPGVHAESLEDQTCEHFKNVFLTELVAHQTCPTFLRVFQHNLKVDDLKSWDSYCYEGERLLCELKRAVENGDHDPNEDSFILVGHKLGGFILKSALIIADQRKLHLEEDGILMSIDLLMLLGDPQLCDENRSEWVKLLTECCSHSVLALPLRIQEGVRCLQEISRRFDEFTVFSSKLQLDGSYIVKSRKNWRMRRVTKHRGCICHPSVGLREYTTTSAQKILDPMEGDPSVCTFSSDSAHFKNLITAADTTVYASIKPRVSPPQLLPHRDTSELTDLDSSKPVEFEHRAKNHTEVAEAPFQHQAQASSGTRESHYWESSHDALFDSIGNKLPQKHSGLHEASTRNGIEFAVAPTALGRDLDITIDAPVMSSQCSSSGRKSRSCLIRETSEFNGVSQISPEEQTAQRKRSNVSDQRSVDIGTDQNGLLNSYETAASQRMKLAMLARVEVIELVNDLLCGSSEDPHQRDNLTHRRGLTVLLHGAAGIGKTATAECIAHHQKDNFDHVFNVRAENAFNLGLSLHRIAVSIGLVDKYETHSHRQSRQILHSWMNKTNSSWLLIFDDIQALELLDQYWSWPGRGSYIITARTSHINEERCSNLISHSFKIGPLNIEQSMSLLRAATRLPWSARTKSRVRRVVEMCGGQPLALLAAAKVIRRQGLSHFEIARTLLKIPADLRKTCPGLTSTLSLGAQDLDAVCSLFDGARIDEYILRVGTRSSNVPLRNFPCSQRQYLKARQQLYTAAGLEVHNEPSQVSSRTWLSRVWSLQETILSSLSPRRFQQSLDTCSSLILDQWPVKRRLGSILRGRWAEFDDLHSHVWAMYRAILAFWSLGYKYVNVTSRGKSVAAAQLPDSYLRLLVLSIWYNAQRGNEDEDQELFELVREILNASDIRSHNKGLLHEVAPRSSNYFYVDALDECESFCSRVNDISCTRPVFRNRNITSLTMPRRLLDTSALPRLRILERPEEARAQPYVALLSALNILSSCTCGVSDEHRWDCVAESLQAPLALSRKLGVRFVWLNSCCDIDADNDGNDNDKRQREERIRAICAKSAVTLYDATVRKAWLVSVPTPLCFATRALGCGFDLPSIDMDAQSTLTNRNFGESEDSTKHAVSRSPSQVHQACQDSNVSLGTATSRLTSSPDETADARQALYKAKDISTGGDHLASLALLVQARDAVSAFKVLSPELVQIYTEASIHLVHTYIICGLNEAASQSLLQVQTHVETFSEDMQPSKTVRAQLLLARLAIEAKDPAHKLTTTPKVLYQQALDLSQQDLDPATPSTDTTAFISLKLAEQYRTPNNSNDLEQSLSLLQRTIDHFQRYDSEAAQSQLARAFRHQALVYELQGNKGMYRAMRAAARETLSDLRASRGESESQAGGFEMADYDEAIREYWFR